VCPVSNDKRLKYVKNYTGCMKRVHLIVSGKVIGVFYRDFARKEADRLGVKGFVRNLRDGTVEVVAEGEDEKVDEFIKSCKKGSFASFVKNVEVKQEKPTNEFEDFEVRF
jgi:acylphosphatase